MKHALALVWLLLAAAPAWAEESPDYARQVAPILNKYCAGCHNVDDAGGELSLDDYEGLQRGGENGPALLPGDSASSRIIRVLTGKAEPAMPPDGEPAPTPEEIALLSAWIDAGAPGPDGTETQLRTLHTPEIEPAENLHEPIAALAYSPDGKLLAVARFGRVELRSAGGKELVRTLDGHPGKVNAVEFTADGKSLIAASGIVGLYGEARLWNVSDGALLRTFNGHRDTLYAATVSRDGKHLATASYDRKIILWDLATGEQLRTLTGHNDAIYDVAFSPDGSVLASASGDETVKIWHVARGERLDTLGQPEAEQYTVTFSPDGRYILAGGHDNRIRVWRWVSKDAPRINPLLFARFAHEGAVVQLAYTPDGKTLVSVSDDRTIKLFETETFTQRHQYDRQPDATPALAIDPEGTGFAVGRMDGSLQRYPLVASQEATATSVAQQTAPAAVALHGTPREQKEAEPNDEAAQATPLTLPALVQGVIRSTASDKAEDTDLYRIEAKAGQELVLEVEAARKKSPLDSKVEVLTATGERILQVNLQAVRDSYFTFRGKDSTQSGDFRVHNYEEMELNEYLYAQGEVARLYRRPRGPDSGFDVYGSKDKRRTFFGTTGVTHALGETCYIVEPHLPGEELIANGLPVFPVYYENDDDPLRQWGTDSRLTFTAPHDGTYLVRISDARGFQGKNFRYALTIRAPQPDFTVKLHDDNPRVGEGSGREFRVVATRIDGFDGEIRVEIEGVPPGFAVTTPLVIEAGHHVAYGVLNAAVGAPQPTPENAKRTRVTATAVVEGTSVTKEVNNLGQIHLAPKPALLCSLTPEGVEPVATAPRKWTVLEPKQTQAESAAQLAVQEDQSIFVQGESPETDRYTIVLETPLEKITGIRLEALADERLPHGGPGRGVGNGNFVLTELHVTAAPLNQSEQTVEVPLATAAASYSQPGWPVYAAMDGKPETGWAVGEEAKQKKGEESKEKKIIVRRRGGDASHEARFEFAQPVGFAAGTRLVVTLQQKSQQAQHTLGRFRLSVSTDPAYTMPKPQELVIAPGETIAATLRIERNGNEGDVAFEAFEVNLPHGVYIDNVGLNGVLIPADHDERTVYFTASDWVAETTRPLHLKTRNGPASWPVRFQVRKPQPLARGN